MPASKQGGRSSGRATEGSLARDALTYAGLDYPVFPCRPGAKDPATQHGFKDATTDARVIRAAFRNGANIGLIAPAAVLVLDVDDPDRIPVLEDTFAELAEAPRHDTPSGGAHLFVRVPDGWKMPTRARAVEGVDIRGLGRAYVVAPGSQVDGKAYRVVRPLVPPAALPVASEALLGYLNPAPAPANPHRRQNPVRVGESTSAYGRRALEQETDAVASTPEGGRNDRLNTAAFSLGQLVAGGEIATEAEVVDALMSTPVAQDEPDKSRRTIRSGLEDGKLQPRTAPPRDETQGVKDPKRPEPALSPPPKVVRDDSLPDDVRHTLLSANLTDAGNAERLVALYGDRWRHVPGLGDHAWTGTHWEIDAQGRPRNWATATMRRTARLAIDAGLPDDERKRLIRHALASESRNRINGAVELARSLDAIHLSADRLDQHLDVLNVQNGRLDLKTGTLHPHNPTAYDTKVAPVMWNPDAEHWATLALLELLAEDDREPLLQEIAGASLTGHTEKRITLLIGNSGSGKSTFATALMHLLGSYAQNIEASTLLDKQYGGGGPRADIVRLRGARLGVAGEMPTTHGKLDPGLLKRVTGEDFISARKPHQAEEISFLATFTLIMHANGRPSFDALDAGMLARITEIPFNAMPKDPNKPVRQALTEDPDARAALLVWAVTGALRWYRNGRRVTLPESVTKATADYVREMDPFAEWAEEALEFTPDGWAATADLYSSYQRWCESVGIKYPPGRTKFGRWLASRPGVTTGDEARRNRVRGALGVRLRS